MTHLLSFAQVPVYYDCSDTLLDKELPGQAQSVKCCFSCDNRTEQVQINQTFKRASKRLWLDHAQRDPFEITRLVVRMLSHPWTAFPEKSRRALGLIF